MLVPNESLEFLVVEVDQVTEGGVGFVFIICCGIEPLLLVVFEPVVCGLLIQEYSKDSMD